MTSDNNNRIAKLRLVAAGLAAGFFLSISAASACGDKIVGLGGGVPFARVHNQAQTPGSIVFLAPPESALRSFDQSARLSQTLQRAGHQVRSFDSDRELAKYLTTSSADVVLADDSTATNLRAEMASNRVAPIVVSLITPTTGVPASEQILSPCRIRASAKQGNRVVREVEKLITRRQAGAAIDCNAGGSRI